MEQGKLGSLVHLYMGTALGLTGIVGERLIRNPRKYLINGLRGLREHSISNLHHAYGMRSGIRLRRDGIHSERWRALRENIGLRRPNREVSGKRIRLLWKSVRPAANRHTERGGKSVV